jgi:hypothetical protein
MKKMGIDVVQWIGKHAIPIVKCDVEGRSMGGGKNH